MSKFKTVKTVTIETERLMTDEEVLERAKELNLSEEVTTFIREQFQWIREFLDDPECDKDEDYFARSDGRLGCFQSHQDVLYELAGVMGYEDEDTECPEAKKVFDRFFAE